MIGIRVGLWKGWIGELWCGGLLIKMRRNGSGFFLQNSTRLLIFCRCTSENSIIVFVFSKEESHDVSFSYSHGRLLTRHIEIETLPEQVKAFVCHENV